MNINIGSRKEVLMHIEKYMLEKMHEYFKPIDSNWQPSDFLPDSTRETFFTEIKDLQENARDLSYDLVAVLLATRLLKKPFQHMNRG